MLKHIKGILNSYSEIFFIQSQWVGILLFLITVINPYVALGGIISVISAYLFAKLINIKAEFLKAGFYTYNPLLTGLAVGYLFKLTPLTFLFMVLTGILTFLATLVLSNIFSYYFRLPILSIPFVIVSSLAYLAASQYSNLFITGLYPNTLLNIDLSLPYWIEGYFKSLGAIFFMPNVISGIIIALIILIASRIVFMLSVAGYYAGTLLVALMVGSYTQSFSDINHFNFILIAISVGGIFLIPSLKSYLIAIVSVCISTILLDAVLVFWSTYGIPAFTLPFNVISLSIVYTLGINRYPYLTYYFRDTPEETLDLYLSNIQRYKGSYITLSLPFTGKWTVYQGFNGKWTHQGNWKYAYDFVITDDSGSSYKNTGDLLEDYYCFRKPVLSPVRGRIVKVINTLQDMPIGQVDKTNNWGNLVVIKDDRGFFVEISHLAENSIKLNEGDWVEKGSFIGLCGNSGYSPQPHIHIQVQELETVAAYTIPFSFTSYIENNIYHANNLPYEGAVVEPHLADNYYENITSFILDNEYNFEVYKKNKLIANLDLIIKMAIDGTFYFDSGKGKLYFGKHENTFYFYSVEGNDDYLNIIFQSMPRFPVSHKDNLTWNDNVPFGIVAKGFRKNLVQLISSFNHNITKVVVNSKFESKRKITSIISSKLLNINLQSSVEFDDKDGFKNIKIGDTELRRIYDEKN